MSHMSAIVGLVTLLTAGTEVQIDGMKSMAPKSWKDVPTSSSMRYKQFSIPRATGDAFDCCEPRYA